MVITYTYGEKLYINLTNRCPNACEFCVREQGAGLGDADSLWLEREPTREEVLEELKQRDLNSYPEVVFCGYGEPCCRLDDMLWLCGKIRELSDVTIRVNTNGLSDLINKRPTAARDGRSCGRHLHQPERLLGREVRRAVPFGIRSGGLPGHPQVHTEASLHVPRVYLSVVDKDMPQSEIAACERICEEAGAVFRVRKYIGS